MKNADELKSLVKEKYGEIARKSLSQLQNTTCCGTQCCEEPHDLTCFNDDYSAIQGYTKDADLKLGCGVPTAVANISPGDSVLDLGSGAGNDAFVARAITGESGKVIGVDMTEAMVEKARQNCALLNFSNVEFRLGEIEHLPVDDGSIDVAISNCVLNLVPDKQRAFGEIYRVLKVGGHFSISDIVLTRTLPENLQSAAEMYAGCVSGAIPKSDYLDLIREGGFKNVAIKIEKAIELPRSVLTKFLSSDEVDAFLQQEAAIVSITVYGEK